ncbi:class I SAM-dependent methyltransferase [Streptomyces sp. SID14478]|uniref:class I SAM-dependent methyltransferase n=1 Tax=Streptomyces sp. SID14478 TaxID=2706073 RepID=UPI0013DC5214|nr:class I SAM-dependent methyltransferase [Streptomyces sp. SID14478]NEB77624.1 class I SAM-dependent methyltransferase [Streptomyces sp. SID14478]
MIDSSSPSAPYTVTAEFYDLLHAEFDRRRTARLYGPHLDRARVVVDLGAGSGLITLLALATTGALVHAVEPAAPMRALLITRLATAGSDQRARVTVHDRPLDQCPLTGTADLIVCHNIIATLSDVDRRALWEALARTLQTDGYAMLQRPPTALPEEAEDERLVPVRVGQDTYSAVRTTEPAGDHIACHFTYTVTRDEVVLRRHRETFTLHPLPLTLLHDEWDVAGLEIADATKETIAIRRARESDPVS